MKAGLLLFFSCLLNSELQSSKRPFFKVKRPFLKEDDLSNIYPRSINATLSGVFLSGPLPLRTVKRCSESPYFKCPAGTYVHTILAVQISYGKDIPNVVYETCHPISTFGVAAGPRKARVVVVANILQGGITHWLTIFLSLMVGSVAV